MVSVYVIWEGRCELMGTYKKLDVRLNIDKTRILYLHDLQGIAIGPKGCTEDHLCPINKILVNTKKGTIQYRSIADSRFKRLPSV